MISTPSTQTIYLDGNEIDSATPLYINHNSDEETYINPTGGLVGIGTTNPQGKLHINTDEVCLSLQRDFATWWITPVQNGNINFFKNTALLGYISYNGGGEWVAVSDRRLKNSITPMGDVLSKINQLGVYSYSFIHDETGSRDIGVIAQELETIFPEAVSVGNDLYTVSYDQLTSIAIKGIQEQQKQIEQLITRVDQLSKK